jgi:hypothetical protein
MTHSEWRKDTPPAGRLLEVWHDAYGCIMATWTGAQWRTPDGVLLLHVTHWRER